MLQGLSANSVPRPALALGKFRCGGWAEVYRWEWCRPAAGFFDGALTR